MIYQTNVRQEVINQIYAETCFEPTNWIGPSWIDKSKWQQIIELSKTVER